MNNRHVDATTAQPASAEGKVSFRQETPPLVIPIILNWNDHSLTLDTLASLREQSYPRLQTIVIDNGSSNQAEALQCIKAAFPHVRAIGSKRNLGFAGGCNAGIRMALKMGADYLMLLNNDVLLHPTAISELVTALQSDPRAGAAGPLIYYASEPTRVWFGGGTMQMGGRVLSIHDDIDKIYAKSPQGVPRHTDWLPGTAILVRKEAVERAGLLDPAYFLYWEDVDWCYKLKKAGYGLLFVPGSVIWHKINATTGSLPSLSRVYYWERNRLKFVEKWGTWKSRFAAWGKILWRSLAWRVRLPKDDIEATVKLEAYRDYLLRRFGQRRIPPR